MVGEHSTDTHIPYNVIMGYEQLYAKAHTACCSFGRGMTHVPLCPVFPRNIPEQLCSSSGGDLNARELGDCRRARRARRQSHGSHGIKDARGARCATNDTCVCAYVLCAQRQPFICIMQNCRCVYCMSLGGLHTAV